MAETLYFVDCTYCQFCCSVTIHAWAKHECVEAVLSRKEWDNNDIAFQAKIFNVGNYTKPLTFCGLYRAEVTPYSRNDQNADPDKIQTTVLVSDKAMYKALRNAIQLRSSGC